MKKVTTVHFKCHTPQLLTEICECALSTGNFGILKIPLNVLRNYLGLVAQRAAQINDPILNQLMCEMTLYEVADPYSKDYDAKVLRQVAESAEKQRIEENKNT
jgi:hypothetical protein